MRKFPHIARKIPARIGRMLPPALWGALMGLFILNLYGEYVALRSPEGLVRHRVLAAPFSAQVHENLALLYLPKNRDAAGYEFARAQELLSGEAGTASGVLGSKAEPWNTWQQISSYSASLDEERRMWERIGEMLPSYTYAKAKLAVLYDILGDDVMSRTVLWQAFDEYPSGPYLLEIEQRIGRK